MIESISTAAADIYGRTTLEPDRLNATDMVRRSGASFRQIDHWCRNGYLRTADGRNTPGSGVSREFMLQDLRVARVMVVLSALGLPGNRMKECAHELYAKLRYFDGAGWAVIEATRIGKWRGRMGVTSLNVRVTTDNSTNGPAWVVPVPVKADL